MVSKTDLETWRSESGMLGKRFNLEKLLETTDSRQKYLSLQLQGKYKLLLNLFDCKNC